jgi:hypothetical protein
MRAGCAARRGDRREGLMALARLRAAIALALAAAIGFSAAASPLRADGVTAALLPTGQTVTPGAEFELVLQCTEAGDLFNAFKAIVAWDPAALTFIRLSPLSAQEGSYMKEACGNTFHVFGQGASTDTISDALMCNNVFLSGPGPLYRLRFRAATTPQVTSVWFLGLQFYKAGMYVDPVHATGSVIGIGLPAPAGVGDPAVPRLALSAAPNPSGGALRLTVGADRAGVQRLTVRDVQGRSVRRLAEGWSTPGSRVVAWDGRDAAGGRLPAGLYLVTLEAAGRAISRRVTLLP